MSSADVCTHMRKSDRTHISSGLMARSRKEALTETIDRCRSYHPRQTCQKFDLSDFKDVKLRRSFDTLLTVVHQDTLVAASALDNPVALNLANAFNPGGGWLQLCSAQEESLFYRSGLCRHLLSKFYPLKGVEVLYAADVPVWFGPESQGYPDISQKCSFIACAATNHPVLTSAGRLPKHELELLLQKIHLILHVAYLKGHRNVVMGAIGCGVFANPRADVANCFKTVVKHWDGVFDNVVFAVLGHANFTLFEGILNE